MNSAPDRRNRGAFPAGVRGTSAIPGLRRGRKRRRPSVSEKHGGGDSRDVARREQTTSAFACRRSWPGSRPALAGAECFKHCERASRTSWSVPFPSVSFKAPPEGDCGGQCRPQAAGAKRRASKGRAKPAALDRQLTCLDQMIGIVRTAWLPMPHILSEILTRSRPRLRHPRFRGASITN